MTVWLFLSAALPGLAQGHPLLESFTARQVNDRIQIDFAIVGGASCNGVQLLRSMDGETFLRINEIQGICGGSEFVEYYTLNDQTPFESSTNYYKLVLGTQGESEVISLQFVDLSAGYSIAPNPVQDWALIRFDNPTGLEYTFALYDLSGHQVLQNGAITSAEIHVWLRDVIPGVYIFQLTGTNGRRITGKIVRA